MASTDRFPSWDRTIGQLGQLEARAKFRPNREEGHMGREKWAKANLGSNELFYFIQDQYAEPAEITGDGYRVTMWEPFMGDLQVAAKTVCMALDVVQCKKGQWHVVFLHGGHILSLPASLLMAYDVEYLMHISR